MLTTIIQYEPNGNALCACGHSVFVEPADRERYSMGAEIECPDPHGEVAPPEPEGPKPPEVIFDADMPSHTIRLEDEGGELLLSITDGIGMIRERLAIVRLAPRAGG